MGKCNSKYVGRVFNCMIQLIFDSSVHHLSKILLYYQMYHEKYHGMVAKVGPHKRRHKGEEFAKNSKLNIAFNSWVNTASIYYKKL